MVHKQGWFYIAGYDKWSLSHGINIACAAVVFYPNLARAERNTWEASNGLSLGQTDRQVVASGRKLNLRRDLRWVAKRLASFFASTRKSQKKTF